MKSIARSFSALLCLLLWQMFWPPNTVLAETDALPAGFSDQALATVALPTALAFTPDGRLLITTQTGFLRVYKNNALLATPALDLTGIICNDFERGLLGVTVDPNFSNNHSIYLYYTFKKHGNCNKGSISPTNPVNRVSRFTLADNNLASAEVVLVDNIPSNNGNHNAGDLHFGADGLLYISVGDGGNLLSTTHARSDLSGKILRVNPDGTVPSSNPFANQTGVRRCGDPAGIPSGTGPCGEVFAYGLRNPFRFAFRPGSNQFYINDLGQYAWDEINEGVAGADYGWCEREGPDVFSSAANCKRAQSTNFQAALYNISHTTGCTSITGGAFVPTDAGWPSDYAGRYLFSDYVCGKIKRLSQSAPYSTVDFATGLGGKSAITLLFGPDGGNGGNGGQSLYYTTYANGGQVRRIRYTAAANRVPTAQIQAIPTSGALPLAVTFSGASSSDPDGDPLTYDWDFGDGATSTGNGRPTIIHTYTASGPFQAILVVRDNRGGVSSPASLRIDAGNTAPIPQINTPSANSLFAAGQVISLQGSASDAEDGNLPDNRLTWELFLHHIDASTPNAAHTHPLLAATPGNNLAFTAPSPEDLQATSLSFVEIRLTATDSLGASATVTRTWQPQCVQLTFATEPAALQLLINGQAVTSPSTVTSWADAAIELTANDQASNAAFWHFQSWSDGGNASHTLQTPASNASYTATFTASTTITTGISGRLSAITTGGTTGVPLASIQVTAYQLVKSKWKKAQAITSNRSGEYLFSTLKAGSYRLRFDDPAKKYKAEYYDNVTSLSKGKSVVVTVGGLLTGVNATLQPVKQQVSKQTTANRVYNAQTQEAINHATIHLYTPNDCTNFAASETEEDLASDLVAIRNEIEANTIAASASLQTDEDGQFWWNEELACGYALIEAEGFVSTLIPLMDTADTAGDMVVELAPAQHLFLPWITKE